MSTGQEENVANRFHTENAPLSKPIVGGGTEQAERLCAILNIFVTMRGELLMRVQGAGLETQSEEQP